MKLLIVVDVDVDPTTEDPHEIARYCLDLDCDDHVWNFVGAEWEDNADVLVNSLGPRVD